MTTTSRMRFAIPALLVAVTACDASPLPYPPDINTNLLRLSMTAVGSLTLSGEPGAATPGGLPIRLRDASRPAIPAVISARADGSIPDIAIEGYLIDVLRIDHADAEQPQTLVHIASTTAPDVRIAVPPVDADGDGWADNLDCIDTDPRSFPGAAELCDSVDNDCDGVFDEDSVCTACTADADCIDAFFCNGEERCVDGRCALGDLGCDDDDPETTDLCDESTDTCRHTPAVPAACGNSILDPGEECDDGNAVPGDGCENDCMLTCSPVPETCNGIDDDCDGLIDEEPSCMMTCAAGVDCDDGLYCTHESCADGVCVVLPDIPCDDGDVTTADSCDETDDSCVHGVCAIAVEVCNGIDDDCDGVPDEDVCACDPAEVMCGGACVDLLFDELNCGGCGMACATGETCLRGICTP